MADILAVDDDATVLSLLDRVLRGSAHHVTCASCAREAEEYCRAGSFDLALVDFKLPDLDGISLFSRIHSERCRRGLLLTGHLLEPTEADRAVQSGFVGVLGKPIRLADLQARVSVELDAGRIEATDENRDRGLLRQSESPSPQLGFDGMLGETIVMRRIFATLVRCAPQDTPVLITGATGTGKELVARSIHRRSRRAKCPLVVVNCAAVPITLFESEFFGYERGAFTGADRRSQGWFEQANGGTLFLDEIGDLPFEAQAKILRALECKEVSPIGSRSGRPIDIRIIAATNVDLGALVSKRGFRADLYWRLNGVSIHLPPLAQRREDIPSLVRHLLEGLRSELQIPTAALAPGAISYLTARDWPGNVRELAQVLRRILLDADHFPVTSAVVARTMEHGVLDVDLNDSGLRRDDSLPARLAEVKARLEASWIVSALKDARGHHSRAARALGINRKTLYQKMERYGLTADVASED